MPYKPPEHLYLFFFALCHLYIGVELKTNKSGFKMHFSELDRKDLTLNKHLSFFWCSTIKAG